MTPIVVRNKNGEPEIVSGSGGAGRIPTALSLLLHYHLDLGLSPEESMTAPRLHFQDDFLQMEPGFNLEGEQHRHWNVWKKNSLYFGGAHSIFKTGNSMTAIGDERRAGWAINSTSS
jgi:gamma-glutamyltranspeptidase/glutathione hydrolase